MGAGAIVYCLGGNTDQVFNAVAITIQCMLGLVCDPVAGLVEVPCVVRNASAAAIANTAASPGQAQITIGTAHKAKGCEWNSVRLCRDFLTQPVLTRKSSADPEIRLFYVAMTRAKQALSVDPEMMAIFTGDKRSTDASSVPPPQQTSASHVSTHTEAPKPEPKPDFMNTLFNKAARRRANE